MKRMLIVIALLLGLVAMPQILRAADNNSLVWINNLPKDIQVIWKDGTVYGPIRPVAEALNCKVTWANNRVNINSVLVRPVPPDYADARFRTVFSQAMDLLEEKDPADYAFVCQNVPGFSIMRLAPTNGEIASSCGGDIAFSPAFTKDEKRFTPEYLAGVLAHETCHVAWRMTSENISDPQNEIIAYDRGIYCMKLLGAPQWAIDEQQRGKKKATGED